jgi:hypothetical protein
MSEDKKKSSSVMQYAGLATQWAVMLGVSVWVGLWLDRQTGWKVPAFLILLPLVALGLSLYQLIKSLK